MGRKHMKLAIFNMHMFRIELGVFTTGGFYIANVAVRTEKMFSSRSVLMTLYSAQ